MKSWLPLGNKESNKHTTLNKKRRNGYFSMKLKAKRHGFVQGGN